MLNNLEKIDVHLQMVDSHGTKIELANVLFDVNFYVDGNRRYSFSAGSTDNLGILHFVGKEIRKQWLKNRDFFIMDYNTPIEDCDDIVGFVVPTEKDLSDRLEAVHKWFPDLEKEMLSRFDASTNNNINANEQKFDIQNYSPSHTLNYICEIRTAIF